MLTITFVRHGESVDNVKHIWAGWKDSDLSVHGFNVSNESCSVLGVAGIAALIH